MDIEGKGCYFYTEIFSSKRFEVLCNGARSEADLRSIGGCLGRQERNCRQLGIQGPSREGDMKSLLIRSLISFNSS